MRIGLLSDTHGFLDETLMEHFSACDEIWHAGDIGSVQLLERLSSWKPLRAVFGNIDGPELRSCLPEESEWRCEGVLVFMTHIGGYPGRYEVRAKARLQRKPNPGLMICGHSHVVRAMRDPELDLLHLNPGACGNAGWHKQRTAMRLTVADGDVQGVELIDLGLRGKRTIGSTGGAREETHSG